MILFYISISLHLWAADSVSAKGLICSSLFAEPLTPIERQADDLSLDLLSKNGKLIHSAKSIRKNLEHAKAQLVQRRDDLILDAKNPDSIYNKTDYSIEKINTAIDQMILQADALIRLPAIDKAQYFHFFFRMSAVLSFMKTNDVKQIYDGISGYLGRNDPNYDVYSFVRENFDRFAILALTGKLPNDTEIQKVLDTDMARVAFIYEMPSLGLLTEKMARGVVYATLSSRPTSFDGGPLLFPYDLAKHDVAHAARFVDALERANLSLDKFIQDNEIILNQAKSKLTADEYQIFLSMHFSRNHEGSYDLTYITAHGKYSWLGIKSEDVITMLELNAPENWQKNNHQTELLIESLRRKGFL